MSFYLSTLVVYFFIDALLAWALNLQYGWAGIPNFALIMFQAVGAYAAAVVSLGPDNGINSFQRYVFGASWPFPLPLVAAAVAGGVLAAGRRVVLAAPDPAGLPGGDPADRVADRDRPGVQRGRPGERLERPDRDPEAAVRRARPA